MALTTTELNDRFDKDPIAVCCLNSDGKILWRNQKAKEIEFSQENLFSLPDEVSVLLSDREKRNFSYMSPDGNFFRFFRFQTEETVWLLFCEKDPFSFGQNLFDTSFLSTAQSYATRKIDDLIFLLDAIEDDVLEGKTNIHLKIGNAKQDALATLKLIENVYRMVQNEHRETLYPVSVDVRRYFDLLFSHGARLTLNAGVEFEFQNNLPQKQFYLYDDVLCSAILNLLSLSCGYAGEKGKGRIRCDVSAMGNRIQITYEDSITPIDVFMQAGKKYGLASFITPVLLSQCIMLHKGQTIFMENGNGYRTVIFLQLAENTSLELGNEFMQGTNLAYEKVVRNAEILLSDNAID